MDFGNIVTKKSSITSLDLLGNNHYPLSKRSDKREQVAKIKSVIVAKCCDIMEVNIPYLSSSDISVDVKYGEATSVIYAIEVNVLGSVDAAKFLDRNPRFFGLNPFIGSVDIMIVPGTQGPTLDINVDEKVVGGSLSDEFWDEITSKIGSDYKALGDKLAKETLPYLSLAGSAWADVVLP